MKKVIKGTNLETMGTDTLMLDPVIVPGSYDVPTTDAVDRANKEQNVSIGALRDVIPADATATNKLVTQSDLAEAEAVWQAGYTPKGDASVSTLNGLTGQSNGDTYILTDGGTLSAGSLVVSAGDTVAWDATGEKWYRTNLQSVAVTPKIEDSLNEAEFNIADENDNIIASFKNGNFEVKKFNSEDSVGISNPWKGKTLSILGDSISTYVGYIPSGNAAEYTGSNHGVTDVNQTWWMRVMNKLGLVLGCNESYAGSGICGTDDGVKAISTARLNRIGSNGNPDIIILQIGTNDVNKDFGDFEFWKLAKGESYTLTKFRPAYSYIVEKLLTMYPTAKIVCMSPIYRNPIGWFNGEGNNTYGFSMTDMVESIRKIAEEYHVPFLDLATCGITNGNYETYLTDNRVETPDYQVHPNPKGFEVMANFIIKNLNNVNSL